MTEGPAILLFRGRGIISALIRWQTRSKFSHAAVMDSGGTVVEAWPRKGVHCPVISDWSGITAFRVPSADNGIWPRVVSFLSAQVGHKYDYLGVLRFITRRKVHPNTRWFCSELVAAAFEHAGLPLLNNVPAWAVSPAMLSYSPLLKAV